MVAWTNPRGNAPSRSTASGKSTPRRRWKRACAPRRASPTTRPRSTSRCAPSTRTWTQLREPFARRDNVLADQDMIVLFIDPVGNAQVRALLPREPARLHRRRPLQRGHAATRISRRTSSSTWSPRSFDGGWIGGIPHPVLVAALRRSAVADVERAGVPQLAARPALPHRLGAAAARPELLHLPERAAHGARRDLPSTSTSGSRPQLTRARVTEPRRAACPPSVRTTSSRASTSSGGRAPTWWSTRPSTRISPRWSSIRRSSRATRSSRSSTRRSARSSSRAPTSSQAPVAARSTRARSPTRAGACASRSARTVRRHGARHARRGWRHGAAAESRTAPTTRCRTSSRMAGFARGRWQVNGATVGVLATDRTIEDGRGYNRVARSRRSRGSRTRSTACARRCWARGPRRSP